MSPTSPQPPATDETPGYYQGACCPHCRGRIGPKDLFAAVDGLMANVIKYAFRAGRKPGEPAIKDLVKCRNYLDYAIERESHCNEIDAQEG